MIDNNDVMHSLNRELGNLKGDIEVKQKEINSMLEVIESKKTDLSITQDKYQCLSEAIKSISNVLDVAVCYDEAERLDLWHFGKSLKFKHER